MFFFLFPYNLIPKPNKAQLRNETLIYPQIYFIINGYLYVHWFYTNHNKTADLIMFIAYFVFFLRLSNKPYVTQYRYRDTLIVAPPRADWFIFNVVFFVNLFSQNFQPAIRWTSQPHGQYTHQDHAFCNSVWNDYLPRKN